MALIRKTCGGWRDPVHLAIAPENSLPQLGQVRWASVPIVLTALQPQPEPKATPARKVSISSEWTFVFQTHCARHRVPMFERAKKY
jgi:hypothetical protein